MPTPLLIDTDTGSDDAVALIMALRAPDGVTRHGAMPAEAIDTTGAGDAFCGALAVAWADGAALEDAIARAQRAAAWSVAVEGAQPSLPTAADLV